MDVGIKPKDLNNIEVMVDVILDLINSGKHKDIISDELKNNSARFDRSILKRKLTNYMVTEFNYHIGLGFSPKKSLKMATEGTLKHWGYRDYVEDLVCILLLVFCEYRDKTSNNITRWLRRYNIGSIIGLALFSLFTTFFAIVVTSNFLPEIAAICTEAIVCLELIFVLILVSASINRMIFIDKFRHLLNYQLKIFLFLFLIGAHNVIVSWK